MIARVLDCFWQWVALVLYSVPSLANLLIRLAQRTPYFHLDGYMDRWWLVQPRWWLPFSIRIHHIKRGDSVELHDHPFDYRTILLRGWYIEEDIFLVGHWRYAGDTVKARAQHFHRIAEVSEGGVWTLFIMGPRINSWGFLIGGSKQHWYDVVQGQPGFREWQTTQEELTKGD